MLNEQQKQLVESNIGLVVHIVDKYFKNNFFYIDRQELIDEGVYWLCKCTMYYDNTRGTKYSTYVYKCLKVHLTEYVVNFYNKNSIDIVEFEECKNLGYEDKYNIDTSEEMKEFLHKYIKEKKANMIIDYYFNNLSWEQVARKYGYANRKAACAICQKELKKLGNNNYLKNKMIKLFV